MKIRKRTLPAAVLIFGLTIFLLAQSYHRTGLEQRYFPPRAFADQYSDGSFLAGWYASQLQAMGEPSLSVGVTNQDAVAYRFTWLRTFHHPIAARFVLTADGTGTLRLKMADGAGGYRPGKLIMNANFSLSSNQVQHILFLLREMDFWQSPSIDPNERMGDDGSEWVLEGRKPSGYHAITRWSPREGSIHDLGLYLVIDIAKLNIPKREIY